MIEPDRYELRPGQLRWRCGDILGDRTFEEVAPAETTVGQERAVKALQLGLDIRSSGYNVFVSGWQGTGRTTSVRELLESVAKGRKAELRDRVYVHNFRDVDQPKLLEFPVGQAVRFKQELDRFVAALKRDIAKILEDESVKRERVKMEEAYRDRTNKLVHEFDEKLKKQGFALTKVRLHGIAIPEIMPVIKEQAVPMHSLDDLVKEGVLDAAQARQILKRYEALGEEFEAIIKQMTEFTKEVAEKVAALERRAVTNVLRLLLADLKTRFPSAGEYLDSVGEGVMKDLDAFRGAGEEQDESQKTELEALITPTNGDPFHKYKVNVIQDNSGRTEVPIVFEDVPSYTNLIGSVELQFLKGGTVRTGFTNIRGGSLLRADGGFLVLNALDLFLSPGAWPALKRVLKTGRLEISVPDTPLLLGTVTMKPEPIAVDVKVVLIGEPFVYDLLWNFEPDFRSIFKVKADFDSQMKLTEETQAHFVSVLSRICQDEKLLPFEPDGLSALLEEGVRRAGRQGRITTRFSEVGDLARESTHWAAKEGAKRITAAHVRRAIDEQDARHQLMEEKVQDMIDEGLLAIEAAGERVGQVNGLSVYDLGMYAFGRPSRITASVSMGRAGVVSVDREAGLSGRIHNKGVLTIAGLMRERYAQDFPLSLSASISFEQSYGGVEGDSASSTEVYSLMSALSGVPIRQSIAVTGSVDQKGMVEAIGGVNQKVEGFFTVCKKKGLTGRQGVMIPRANAKDLMLREDVIEAVGRGEFHIWAIETIDEGIEILTGVAAGERDRSGVYPADSINGRVQRRLREFAETLARFERNVG